MGEVELVAAADEHPERAVAAPVVVGRVGETAAEQVDRRVQLALGVLVGERDRDVLGRDAGGEQSLLDALGAPRVDLAPVLGEAARVRRVVEVAPLTQDRDRLLGDLEVDVAVDQVTADLGDGVVTPREPLPGEVERVLERVAAERLALRRGGAGRERAVGVWISRQRAGAYAA